MHGLQSPFKMILASLTLMFLLGAQSTFGLRDAEIGSQHVIRRHARRPQGSDPNHGLSRRFHSIAELGSEDLEERQSLLDILDGALDDASTRSSSSTSSRSTSESVGFTTSSPFHPHNSTKTSTRTRTRTRTHTGTRTHTRVATLSDDSSTSESSSATYSKSASQPSSSSSSDAHSTSSSHNNNGLLGNSHSSSDSSDQGSSDIFLTSSSHANPSHTRAAQVAHHTFGSSSSSSGSRPYDSQPDADPDFFSFTPVTSTRTHAAAAASDTGLLGHLLGDGSDGATSTRSEAARPTQHSSSDSGSSSSGNSDSGSTAGQDSSSSDSSASDNSSSNSNDGLLPNLLEPTSTSSVSSPDATSTPDAPSQGDGSSKGNGSSSGDDTTTGKDTSTGDGSSGGASSTSTYPSSTASASVPTSSGSVGNSDGGSVVTSTQESYSSTSSGNVAAPTSTATQSSFSTSSQPSVSQSLSSASISSSASASSSASSWMSSSTGSTSASSTTSSTTTNPYWYANTQSLNLAPASTSSYAPAAATAPATTDAGTTASTIVGSSSDSQNYPSVIVPSADSLNQPSDTTSVALLFKNAMTWTWVISQADLTAQIFAFMPALIAQSIGIDAANVTTIKLSSYADSSTTSLTNSRTLYMAFIPSASVEDLQAMVANVSSPFYTDALTGAPQELAKQVDPSFNILLAAGQTLSSAAQSGSTGSSGQTTLRKSLMGVGCSLAGCAVAALGIMFWKRQQQKKVQDGDAAATGGLSRGQTIRSFQGGQRETWPPQAGQEQDHQGHGDMQEAWTPSPYSDGFGGHVAADPFQDQAHAGGAYVNMNRASRMTERSAYSDWSNMTEAQRIQYEYESSRRSYHSGSSQSGSHGDHSAESAGFSTSYQDDHQVPHTQEQQQGSGRRVSPTPNQNRRRGSVASSIIGRPEMVSNSVLL